VFGHKKAEIGEVFRVSHNEEPRYWHTLNISVKRYET